MVDLGLGTSDLLTAVPVGPSLSCSRPAPPSPCHRPPSPRRGPPAGKPGRAALGFPAIGHSSDLSTQRYRFRALSCSILLFLCLARLPQMPPFLPALMILCSSRPRLTHRNPVSSRTTQSPSTQQDQKTSSSVSGHLRPISPPPMATSRMVRSAPQHLHMFVCSSILSFPDSLPVRDVSSFTPSDPNETQGLWRTVSPKLRVGSIYR
ncbi:hypothetical protein C8Q80DRAFT_40056 [Daedaleopsis nitida]|nr:hypothetical protein C8Q80DRAFT_40056 [Daedaleopsis nitida]